jgi:tRNA nucleotidyltransferase (CCA-adding enzyme)
LTKEEKLEVLMGALCHDLGKPSTTKMGEKGGVQRLRSLGHEEAGEEPAKALFHRWKFSQEIETGAIAVTTQHLKPSMLYLQKEKGTLSEEQYINALRKLVKRIYPVSWRVLIAVAEADYRGRAIPGVETEPYAYGAAFEKAIRENHLDEEPTKPLIQGRDLLEHGVKPGKRMGEIIREIENLRDEGKIKTREEALARLAALTKK